MNHRHSHSEHGAAPCDHQHQAGTNRLAWAAVVIVVFFVLELVGGILSHSLALIADAGHMATDALALILALLARWIARRPAKEHMSFGYHRVQILAAFINALALIALVIWLMWEAVSRIAGSEPINAPLMLSVAVLGLIANGVAFFLLHGDARQDLNVRGAMLHVISDLAGSVVAIVAALVILATGWMPIDPLLTFVVCALILISAIRLLNESGHILLEGAPANLQPDHIRTLISKAVPSVYRIKRLYVWMLTPEQPQLAMHVEIDSTSNAGQTIDAINEALKAENPDLTTTIQIEQAEAGSEDDKVRVLTPHRAHTEKDKQSKPHGGPESPGRVTF